MHVEVVCWLLPEKRKQRELNNSRWHPGKRRAEDATKEYIEGLVGWLSG